MGAKIYATPEELGEPLRDYTKGFQAVIDAEEPWIEKVRQWARDNGSGTLKGEIFRYGVADGYAQYVVLHSSPLTLIHLPVGDAWHIPDVVARGLRASDVKAYVERSKHPLFGTSRA
jgi:hypothetical protein